LSILAIVFPARELLSRAKKIIRELRLHNLQCIAHESAQLFEFGIAKSASGSRFDN
jgi:hypothetical protein